MSKRYSKETRQTCTLSLSCGAAEHKAVRDDAKAKGFDVFADYMRAAINAYAGKDLFFPRTHNNQNVKKRGEKV